MEKKMRNSAYLAFFVGLAVLASPPLPASARTPTAGIEKHHKPGYKNFWPKTIPIVLTNNKDMHSAIAGQVVQIPGQAYWDTLPAATRSKLDTLNKLQIYCQAHEGTL